MNVAFDIEHLRLTWAHIDQLNAVIFSQSEIYAGIRQAMPDLQISTVPPDALSPADHATLRMIFMCLPTLEHGVDSYALWRLQRAYEHNLPEATPLLMLQSEIRGRQYRAIRMIARALRSLIDEHGTIAMALISYMILPNLDSMTMRICADQNPDVPVTLQLETVEWWAAGIANLAFSSPSRVHRASLEDKVRIDARRSHPTRHGSTGGTSHRGQDSTSSGASILSTAAILSSVHREGIDCSI